MSVWRYPWIHQSRKDKIGYWEDLAAAASGIAQGLKDHDDIMGMLSSKAFVMAAACFEDDFWRLLRDEIDDARDAIRDELRGYEPSDVRSYLAHLEAEGPVAASPSNAETRPPHPDKEKESSTASEHLASES